MMGTTAESIGSLARSPDGPNTRPDSTMHKTLKYVATFLSCHRIPNRCFSFRGHMFPLCARCTGVGCGQLLALAVIVGGLRIGVTTCLCLMTVMFVDWFIQYTGLVES
ncbi:MAG: DUF2085 domain-containing protein, partial [Planctomycetota bacterium]